MKRLLTSFILLIFLICSSNVIAQTVYITKTGTKYHNDGCRYLSQSKIQIDLASAISKGYGACSVCKPPTKVTSTSDVKTTNTTLKETKEVKQQTNTTNTVSSQQCAAITKAGTRCTRKAEPGSIYCWQHKK